MPIRNKDATSNKEGIQSNSNQLARAASPSHNSTLNLRGYDQMKRSNELHLKTLSRRRDDARKGTTMLSDAY